MTSPPPITRDGARSDAQRELAKPIYHRGGEPWPVRAVHAAGHAIDHVLNRAVNHAPSGGFASLSLVVVVVVVLGIVFLRVGPPRRAATHVGAIFGSGTALTAAQHRQLSLDAAARGEWSAAVLERMRAVARELEERSVVDPRPGRTASEVAADGGARLPAAAEALTRAAETFNQVVYGGISATSRDLEELAAADLLVQQTARSRVVAQ